jgi:hypothetical protein
VGTIQINTLGHSSHAKFCGVEHGRTFHQTFLM